MAGTAKNMHPVDRFVGRRLRALRLMRGMTQAAVAARLGISFQQVQKYEIGHNRMSAGRLYDLATILDCTMSDFFEGVDRNEPDRPVGLDDESARLAHMFRKIPDSRAKDTLFELVRSMTADAGSARDASSD